MKKRETSLQMSRLSMPLLKSMFGEPLIVTLIFFMSGKMYFSESLVPAVYGSTNSNSRPFKDFLWALTFMFILVSDPFLNGTITSRARGRRETLCRFHKGSLPVLQESCFGSFHTQLATILLALSIGHYLIFKLSKGSNGSDVRWKAIPQLCPTVAEASFQKIGTRLWQSQFVITIPKSIVRAEGHK